MRKLVTGIDAAGRSYLVEDGPLAPEAIEGVEGFRAAMLFVTKESPPPARPAGHGDSFDLGVSPGCVHWMVVEYGPNMAFPVHHTDSVDLDVLLRGSVELLLDDGPHPLEPGDCVVVTGVDHGWRAGPDGCLLSVAAIGTPSPKSGG